MNEEFIKQALAELIATNQQSLGIVVSALAKQMDAERLKTDLETAIAAAKLDTQVPPLAIQQATVALAAVHAETLLRKTTKH